MGSWFLAFLNTAITSSSRVQEEFFIDILITVTLFSLVSVYQHFRRTYYLSLQDRINHVEQ